MMDDTIVRDALRAAWEKYEYGRWDIKFDDPDWPMNPPQVESLAANMLKNLNRDMGSVKTLFFDELTPRIPPKTDRTAVGIDDIAERIRKAVPDCPVGPTKNGIAIKLPGDKIEVCIYKGNRVSVHSLSRHTGWDATPWEPDDIATVIALMYNKFDELNEPLKEEYRKRCEERKMRADVELRCWNRTKNLWRKVYDALDKEKDTAPFREEYLKVRKSLYEGLGTPCDDGVLEEEWKEFIGDIKDELTRDRRQAAQKAAALARKEALRKKQHACEQEIANVLGRSCFVRRCSPEAMTNWDEYTVWLIDGQEAVFKDYSKRLGSINQDIIAIVPALEGLLPFAGSLFKMQSSRNVSVRYSDSNRIQYRKDLLQMAGDDEVMLYLAEKMKTLRSRTMLIPAKRVVKLYYYHPDRDDVFLYFSLRKFYVKEEVDLLVEALKQFCAVMKEHPWLFT